MKQHNWLAWILSIVIALTLAGCGGGDESDDASGGGSSSSTSSKSFDGPDGMFLAMADGMEKKRPDMVWNALPKQWRSETQEILGLFAGKMDAEVWEKGVGMMGKLGKLMKEKKDFILANDLVKQSLASSPLSIDEISKQWGQLGEMMTSLSSDISTLDKVKSLDIASTMKDLGSLLDLAASDPNAENEIMAMVAAAKSVKTTVLEQDGDIAKVRVEMEGEEPEEHEMKKIDGTWVPAEMQTAWEQFVTESRAGIAELEIPADQKPMVTMMMGMVDGVLDSLLAANSKEEFEQAIGGIMGMLGPMMGGGGGNPMMPPPGAPR